LREAVSTKDALQRLPTGDGPVERIDPRRCKRPGWPVEFNRSKVDLGPRLATRNVSPPVGGEKAPGRGHEHRQNDKERDSQGVHEDQRTPRCNESGEWSDDIQPQR
jgi:hypothetical protein